MFERGGSMPGGWTRKGVLLSSARGLVLGGGFFTARWPLHGWRGASLLFCPLDLNRSALGGEGAFSAFAFDLEL